MAPRLSSEATASKAASPDAATAETHGDHVDAICAPPNLKKKTKLAHSHPNDGAIAMLDRHLERKARASNRLASSTTTPPPTRVTRTSPGGRPPPLVVEVANLAEDADDDLQPPPTPANVRSLARTELHSAVASADMEAVISVLSAEPSSIFVNDEHGWTPLHNAAALPNAAARAQIVGHLLEHGANALAPDNEGYHPLHWAAACGHVDTLDTLLAAGASLLARSNTGETPLHRASRLGRVDAVRRLLVTSSAGDGTASPAANGAAAVVDAAAAAVAMRNRQCETALDVAGSVDGRVVARHRTSVRRAMLELVPSSRLLLLHHSDCLSHLTGDNHQEHPMRLRSILQALAPSLAIEDAGGAIAPAVPAPAASSSSRSHRDALSIYAVPEYEMRPSSNFEPAAVSELQRAHEPSYVALVEAMAARLSAAPPCSPVPFTPFVQRAGGVDSAHLKDAAISASRVSAGTHAAVRRAAGAVVSAVDAVLRVEARNALCVVRPPGHHAGRRGLRAGSHSTGFCVYNTVMVGAMRALHGPNAVSRVAIIDFDVHHGDGTEEIVRHLAHEAPADALFFASIHLYDEGDNSFTRFYPGSGGADALVANVINVPVAPNWRRAGGGVGRASKASGGRLEWRQAFAQRIIPALRAFCPQLLLLSSGFDGAERDVGNSMLDDADKYHQGLDLGPADFEWMTEQLMSVAACCCPGKVVSVLEGGYGNYVFSKESESGWAIERVGLSENVLAHATALAGTRYRKVSGELTAGAL